MKKLCFALFVILGFGNIHAENFQQAYYISNNNDTVYGWIDMSSDYNNSLECKFKAEKTDLDVQMFYPFDIKGYRFVNEDLYYVSKKINDRNVFLQYLVSGVMDLYFTVDENDIPSFCFEENGKMYNISQKPAEQVGSYMHHDISYRTKLARIFYKYPQISAQIDNLKFRQKEMIKITEEYHALTCTTGEKCIVYTNKDPDKVYVKVRPTLAIYYEKNQLREGLGVINYMYYPSLGIGLSIMYPRVSSKTAAIVELRLSPIKDDVDRALIFNLKIGSKYSFTDKKYAPSLEGGMFFEGAYIPNASDPYFNFGFYLAPGFDFKLNKRNTLSLQIGYHYSFVNLMSETKRDVFFLGLKCSF